MNFYDCEGWWQGVATVLVLAEVVIYVVWFALHFR